MITPYVVQEMLFLRAGMWSELTSAAAQVLVLVIGIVKGKNVQGHLHYLKEKFGHLHIKPDNKNIYNHLWCSTVLLWELVQSWELELVAEAAERDAFFSVILYVHV